MECEYKFNVSPNQARRLLASLSEQGFALAEPEYCKMAGRYYTDNAGILAAQNLSMRVRQEGTHSVLNFKRRLAERKGPYTERQELDIPVHFSSLNITVPELIDCFEKIAPAERHTLGDIELFELLYELLKDMQAQACKLSIFSQTDFTRVTYLVRHDDLLFEVSIDEGYFSGQPEKRFRELEAELKRGDLALFQKLWTRLSSDFNLEAQLQSKLNRGRMDL